MTTKNEAPKILSDKVIALLTDYKEKANKFDGINTRIEVATNCLSACISVLSKDSKNYAFVIGILKLEIIKLVPEVCLFESGKNTGSLAILQMLLLPKKTSERNAVIKGIKNLIKMLE